MHFLQKDIVIAQFMDRYKRFLLDFKLKNDFLNFKKGEVHTAHLANTGSMKTCQGENWNVLLTYSNDPKRKLKFSAHMLHNGQSWIMVNTSLTNKLVKEGLENGNFKELADYAHFAPEIKIGKSRIDFILSDTPIDKKNLDMNANLHFVEVKNVTLRNEDCAEFPDAVSERGQKHLIELTQLVRDGHKATMLYIVSRQDVSKFNVSDIDKKYKELLYGAIEAGVEVLVYQLELTQEEMTIGNKMETVL